MRRRPLSLALALAASVAADSPFSAQQVPLPNVNTDMLGSMVAVGQFEGISTYDYTGQENITSGTPVPAGSDRLYAQSNDSFLLPLNDINGYVSAACQLGNVVYFAGNFSSVGSTNASSGVASVNVNSGSVSALGSNQDLEHGQVNALYCDSDKKIVYAGGDFSFNQTSAVAVWNTSDSKWAQPLFEGFGNNSAVNSITNFNGNLVFGGSFDTLANASFLGGSHNGSMSSINEKQWVSFQSATVSAQGTNGQGNPNSITCPGNQSSSSSSSWSLTDGRQGTWTASWPFEFTPTRLRLYNLNDGSGNGLKTFNFIAFPINGIMNLTYVDPQSHKNMTCDASCPLPQASDAKYVDFYFVNNVGMDSFQLNLLDYYGQAAGLSGLEIFSSDLITYADNDFNKPACSSEDISGGSASQSGPNWSPLNVQGAAYMSSTITDSAQLSQLSATFSPNITVKANYSVKLYTPSCVADNTCTIRGGVNASVYYKKGEPPVSTVIYQTNNNEKYDTIYTGEVSAIDGDFKPRVELTPLHAANMPYNIVAERVQFVFLNATNTTDDNDSSSSNSTTRIKLNGLFEYSYDNFTKLDNGKVPVGNTSVNQAGVFLDPYANIRSTAVTSDGKLLIGGQFSGQRGSNFAIIDKSSGISQVSGKGLNGAVNQILVQNSTIIVGGAFTASNDSSTTKQSNVAQYDASGDKWSGLGNGVDGEVTAVQAFAVNGTSAIAISGNFSHLSSSNGTTEVGGSGGGLAVWLESANQWLEQTKNATQVSGRLSTSVASGQYNFYFGSLRVLSSSSQGAAAIGSDLQVSPLPFKFGNKGNSSGSSSNSSSKLLSSLAKRAQIDHSANGNSIHTAVFANGSTTILGGSFTAQDGSGNSFQHLLVVQGNNVTGLKPSDMNSNSTIYTLLVNGDQVVVGGDIVGNAPGGGGQLTGILFYDLNANALSKTQPPGVSGDQGIVTSVALRPNSQQLLVMGSFEQVGSLDCSAFCIYDMQNQRWDNPVNSGISGQITQSNFLNSSYVLVAGDISLNDTSTYLAGYDFSAGRFNSYNDISQGLPGPINSFVLNGEDVKSIFASGVDNSTSKSYLAYWNDSNWTRLDSVFEAGTVISEVKLFDLNTGHKANSMLPTNELLVVSGNLALKEFGNVSTVMYDGQSWQPLFLTSQGGNSGGSGMVYSVSSQKTPVFQAVGQKHHLARGFVVLVALAIAVGLILVVILLGLLISYWRKRRMGYLPAPNRVSEVDMTQTVPPANLFEEMGQMGRRF